MWTKRRFKFFFVVFLLFRRLNFIDAILSYRTPAKADPTGRDGFGQDFIVSEQPTTSAVVADQQNAASLRCDICNVSVTSLQQIEMHYNGQKHKKKLKAMGFDGANGNLAIGSSESEFLTLVCNRNSHNVVKYMAFLRFF